MSVWPRFWCPTTGSYSLADNGFLADPEAEHAHIYQPDAKDFAAINHLPCLALLGEPGIGKSTAIQSIIAALSTHCAGTGEDLLTIDLAEYGSEDRFERNVVGTDQFRRWSQQDGVLHLVLDSLDECRIRIPNVSSLLLGLFRSNSVALERLHIRIACRTADWPSLLTAGLKELWGDEGFQAYELLPLRRKDVSDAARAAGIDDQEFINALCKAGAQPLAIKPITLRFLIDRYKRGEGLPATQAELYESGCHRLCIETNASRKAAGHVGSLDPDHRLAIAARIAALMILCRKTVIAVDPPEEVDSSDVMPLSVATGRIETVRGNDFAISEAELKEVLATGLFSGRGDGLLGFAHQTYAEYLAAKYLATHNLELAQITSLVCHVGESNRAVVPQLAELTGWLASMCRSVFDLVMESDPAVLLRSDAATADNTDRETLIVAVLEKLNDGDIDDRDWSLRDRCARFVYPGLEDQLRAYIVDKTKDTVARRVAIDVTEAAELIALQDALVAVAIDSTDDHHIRDQAAHAIAEIGDEAHRQELLPLLNADEAEDPDDQLRGCAMRSLWPKRLIKLEELLKAIKTPRRESFAGTYYVFLAHDFVSHLMPEEVHCVLEWLCNQSKDDADDSNAGLRRLSDGVVSLAVERLDDDITRVAFAKLVLKKLEEFDRIYSTFTDAEDREALYENQEQRQALVSEILLQLDNPDKRLSYLVWSQLPLVKNVDLKWLLTQAIEATDPGQALQYARLASSVFNINSAEDVGDILDAANRCLAISKEFERYLKPIELASKEAAEIKKQHDAYKDMTIRREESEPLDPPMTERVKEWLQRCESGEVDAWSQLNYCMVFDESGHSHGYGELEDDLRSLPGWIDAEQGVRNRIVEAAKVALRNGEPNNSAWLGTNTFHRPSCAGYRALVLLAHEKSETLQTIPAQAWAKWAASTLGFPVSIGIVGKEQPALDLVALAYANAPEATIQALLVIIDKENSHETNEHLFIIRKMQNCWDEQLCEAMLAKAKDGSLKPYCIGDLLGELLEHGQEDSKTYAEALVTVPVPRDERELALALKAAVALVEHADDAGWPVVWPACLADSDFGHSLIEAIARDERNGGLAIRLPESEVASLYIWLANEYPHSEDPDHDGVHFVGLRESVAHFRDAVLRVLQERGTAGALTAIQRISDELPHLRWLKHTLVTARDRMLRQSWLPPQPEDVLALCAARSSRLVRTANELQSLLIEVLEEIGMDLQGETPAAPELWNLPTSNADKATSIRPKDENRLSDWLKLRLDAKLKGRGVISLREVEIRRGEGAGDTKTRGQRTDLHITGIVPGAIEATFDTVRVIVEVKGCWHAEVKTAMETQLVDRYLVDNACQNGIYVVGWFMCDQWDAADRRKTVTPKWSIDQARYNLEQQSAELSAGESSIRAVVLNTALR